MNTATHHFEQAHANFQAWNEALQTKNPAIVAALYTEDASFLPTVATQKNGHLGATEYFEHFLQKNPFGTIVADADTVQTADEGKTIMHSGIYDFELDGDEERVTVRARFTYVWQLIDGEWKIIHHHSSKDPEA